MNCTPAPLARKSAAMVRRAATRIGVWCESIADAAKVAPYHCTIGKSQKRHELKAKRLAGAKPEASKLAAAKTNYHAPVSLYCHGMLVASRDAEGHWRDRT